MVEAFNSTRGIIMVDQPSPTDGVTNIDFVTIATTGNSIDFGDLIQADIRVQCQSCSSRTHYC